MRIYLDVCAIQRPFDDRSQSRVDAEAIAAGLVFVRIAQGKCQLIASDPLWLETGRNPFPARQGYIITMLLEAAVYVEATSAVEERARDYVAAGIKPLDALHLASAVEGSADFFCTCDDRLLRRGRSVNTGKMRVLTLVQLVEEVDK